MSLHPAPARHRSPLLEAVAVAVRGEDNLHLTEPGSDLWRERLTFRDALRSDSALASEYDTLKQRLADENPGDMVAYTNGKRDFVIRVLAAEGIQLGRR